MQLIGGLVNAFTKLDKMPKDRSVFYPAFLYNWKFQVENTMKKTNDFTEGSQIIQRVMTVITKIAMGITVLVGQKIGEKRPHEAGIIGSGIATSVLAGLCLSYLFYTYVLYFDAQNHIGVPTSIKLPSKS